MQVLPSQHWRQSQRVLTAEHSARSRVFDSLSFGGMHRRFLTSRLPMQRGLSRSLSDLFDGQHGRW